MADINQQVTDALITVERLQWELDVAEGRLHEAKREYERLRERQRVESPTLGDLVEMDARRPVRGY